MDLESELRLVEDAAAVAAFLEENGGLLTAGWTTRADPDLDGDPRADPELAQEPGVYWATMRPRSARSDIYHARLAWSRYPGAPPSVKFATDARGRLDVTSAWPICPGYRPPSFDICSAFTSEGFATHPEWNTQHPWPTTGNPFLWVVQLVQGHLDRSYGGRAQ